MRRLTSPRGFTLVELLVVIGIIALLISILLPGLSAARRQANAVKCATQLREIGNAFKFYALDNKNYYPPLQINANNTTAANIYSIDGLNYPQPVGSGFYGAFWFNILNKYVSKTTVGVAGTAGGNQNQADARKTVLWGCSAFDGYPAATGTDPVFDTNPINTGYCMNAYPTYNAGYPVGSAVPPQSECSYSTAWTPATAGCFIKANVYGRRGSERMLVADGRLWLGDTGYVAPVATRTERTVPTQNWGDRNAARGSNETYISLWRHGKLPGRDATGYFNPNTSKCSFNILYCDGHVVTETAPVNAYISTRLKYPG